MWSSRIKSEPESKKGKFKLSRDENKVINYTISLSSTPDICPYEDYVGLVLMHVGTLGSFKNVSPGLILIKKSSDVAHENTG